MRSLDAAAFRRGLLRLVLGTTLLAAWGAWFFLARVTRYEVSDAARLEVDAAVHPVDATAAGRIIALRLLLGKEVRAGDVLARIDSGKPPPAPAAAAAG